MKLNLFVTHCQSDLTFYKNVFGATVVTETLDASGKGYCEIKLEDYTLGLVDENPAEGRKTPKSLGGFTPFAFVINKPLTELEQIKVRYLAQGGYPCDPCTMDNPIITLPDGKKLCNILDLSGYCWSVVEQ